MAYGQKNLTTGMSEQEYEHFCYLDQLIQLPLDLTPPVRAKTFLSQNEKTFLTYLINLFPNHLIFPQVQLIRLIEIDHDKIDESYIKKYDHTVREDTNYTTDFAYWQAFNMINLLSVDFVVADCSGQPKYAIELDGKEHKNDEKTIERDKIKTYVFSAIKIPLLRIENEEIKILNTLEIKLKELIK